MAKVQNLPGALSENCLVSVHLNCKDTHITSTTTAARPSPPGGGLNIILPLVKMGSLGQLLRSLLVYSWDT